MKKIYFALFVFVFIGFFAGTVEANHSWGTYHWGRTANPLNLKLGDNLSFSWDTYLSTVSSDWSTSSVLDTTIVTGFTNPKNCKGTLGRVEVCNSKYGNNGWLGIAQIWVSGSHITQGVVKMNDTYFSTSKYNTPSWKQMVLCQEIGHIFGLYHQDENFSNPNLGTCMDYTNDPSTNEHPNTHDFDQLVLIYEHLDTTNTSFNSVLGKNANVDFNNMSEWGRMLRFSPDKKNSLFMRDFGHDEKVFTFVIWAE